MYRGSTFGNLFSEYAKFSGKPLLVGEFGVDAFDAYAGIVDEAAHAQYTINLVEELERHSVACITNCETPQVTSGGYIMSWVDEYWKGVGYGADSGRGCPDFNPNIQSACGQYNAQFPDYFMNEEWWGMVGARRGCNTGDPDVVTPRRAFIELSLNWRLGGCTPMNASGSEGQPLASRSFDTALHPQCGFRMQLARSSLGAQQGFITDCEVMAFVHATDPLICPPPPAHMLNVSRSVADERLAYVTPSCQPSRSGAFSGRNISMYPALVTSRMKPVGQALYLDGRPFLVRGVCYSPVPVGNDPGYGEPWGDYFTTDFYKIFTRDIELFVRMGANTIRLYTFKTSQRHGMFLDAADAAGLIVMGAFEIGTAEHTSLATTADREAVKGRLGRQLRLSRHRALTMWFVGNEMNGPWQGFVCEDNYAEQYLKFTQGECQFKDNAVALMMVVDELCQVVHEEGMLCTTPLAGISMPDKYTCFPTNYPGCAPFGPGGWIKYMDPMMQHIDVWSANLYPGRDFREFNFSIMASYTVRPFFVSEYGVDAYNINVPKCPEDPYEGQVCNNHPSPNMIGQEDEVSQADWVMSLIEGIEKNAVTCTHGCESRTVAGGSVMAWVDEWWKGRVIDAVDSDERNAVLGPLCPDVLAELQSPCGYPTPYGFTQPDRFVNEEWFGLFRVKQPCANQVDQIEPREAWFRIKALWKYGGCLLHDDDFNQTHLPMYDTADYPGCGNAISHLRETWNYTATALGYLEYPFDCTLLRVVHEGNTSMCPPLPSHMVNISSDIVRERSNWTDTPEECTVEADTVSLLMPLLALLVVMTVYSRSKHKLIRMYHLQLRRPLARLLQDQHARLLISCLGRLIMLTFVGGLGLAVGLAGGELTRLLLQDPGKASVSFGSMTIVATYVELGGVIGMLGFASVFVVVMLLRDLVLAIMRMRKARQRRLRSMGKTRRTRSRSPAKSGLWRSLLGSDGFENLYLLHESVERRNRPSQRMVASPHDLHPQVLPVASHLGRIFGFQQRQPRKDSHGGDVLSNVACQVNHVCRLLVHRVQRHREHGPEASLRIAIHELHTHVFANFEHWRKHLQLPMPDGGQLKTPKGTDKEADAAYLCNLRLYELMLFFLIYGEAANVRHLPEAMCFIFYCARLRLRFDRNGRGEDEPEPARPRMFISRGGSKATEGSETGPFLKGGTTFLAHEDYLNTIITPLYTVLQREISTRQNEPIDERVMYDDVNESFWNPQVVRSILGAGDDGENAYEALKTSLASEAAVGSGKRVKGHRRLFRKTYNEHVSMLHVFFTFYRIIVLHALCAHALVAIAFTTQLETSSTNTLLFRSTMRTSWAVATCSVTNALLMLFRLLWGATTSQEKRSNKHARQRRVLATLLFFGEMLCHATQPVLLALEVSVPALSGLDLGINAFGWQPTLFELVAYAYLLLSVLPLLRITPSVSEFLLGDPFLGSGRQLRPDAYSTSMYTLFWVITFGLKLLFDYYSLIAPIVEPTRKLMQVDMYCWHYNSLYGDCDLDSVDPVTSSKNSELPASHLLFGASLSYIHIVRWMRMRYFNFVLVALRWMTPLIIMICDTILAYTFVSAVWSGLLGRYYRIAEVVEWSDMVRRIEDSVRLLNTTLLADEGQLKKAEQMHLINLGPSVAPNAHIDGRGDDDEAGGSVEDTEVRGRLAALLDDEQPPSPSASPPPSPSASPPPSPPTHGLKNSSDVGLPMPATLPPRADTRFLSHRFFGRASGSASHQGAADEVEHPPAVPKLACPAPAPTMSSYADSVNEPMQDMAFEHADWTTLPFSIEARSREWQSFAMVWNEIVRDLRGGDFLSNAEVKELLFNSIGGEQVEAFFGVPEYVIFPTMLTGPVFCTKVLQSSYHDFPSFERTYSQLRDLLVFIATSLGMVHAEQLTLILSACNEIGKLLDKQMRTGWQLDANAPLKLRDALSDVLIQLISWQQSAAAQNVLKTPDAQASNEVAAEETLGLVRQLFLTLGTALCVDETELNDYLDMDTRAAHYAEYTPVVEPATSRAEKMMEELEKRPLRRTMSNAGLALLAMRSARSTSPPTATAPASEEVASDDDIAADEDEELMASKAVPRRLPSKPRAGARVGSATSSTRAAADGGDEDVELGESGELLAGKAVPSRLASRKAAARKASWMGPAAPGPEVDSPSDQPRPSRSSFSALSRAIPTRVLGSSRRRDGGDGSPPRSSPSRDNPRSRIGLPLNLSGVPGEDEVPQQNRCSALQAPLVKAKPKRMRRGSVNAGESMITDYDDTQEGEPHLTAPDTQRLQSYRNLQRTKTHGDLDNGSPPTRRNASVPGTPSPPASPPEGDMAMPPAMSITHRAFHGASGEEDDDSRSSGASVVMSPRDAFFAGKCAPPRLAPKKRAPPPAALLEAAMAAAPEGSGEGAGGKAIPGRSAPRRKPGEVKAALANPGISIEAPANGEASSRADLQTDSGRKKSPSTRSSSTPRAPPRPMPPRRTFGGGQTRVEGLDVNEVTVAAQMEASLGKEHRAYALPNNKKSAHPLLRLLRMIRLEALARPHAVEDTTMRLSCSRYNIVFSSLLRSLRTGNPSGEPVSEEAQRQVIFFCNSLHHRRLQRPPPLCEMRSLCAFTPHYAEDVTYSMEALQMANDDNASLLTIVKALCPDEWSNLLERIEGLEKSKTRDRVRMVLKRDPHLHGANGDGTAAQAIDHDELVQAWCSDRSQLLSRTIRGVMRDAHALRVIAMLEGVPADHIEEVVSSKFTYLVTCQIFDKLKNSSIQTDQQKAASIEKLQGQFPRNLRIAYVESDTARGVESSVLMGSEPFFGAASSGGEEEVRVLYKVRLPGNPIIGEGKPENQNHAIIFATGEYLQTLDMNQDNYLGEAFKMRNLLEIFRGKTKIVGFREHIISDSNGLVAGFAASSEFVFGTMIQRFMTWPLMVRRHPKPSALSFAVEPTRPSAPLTPAPSHTRPSAPLTPAPPPPSVAGAPALRPPRRVGRGVGPQLGRYLEGLEDDPRVRGRLWRRQRPAAWRIRRLHRVHPLRQGARHHFHGHQPVRAEDLGRQRAAVHVARLLASGRQPRPLPSALSLHDVDRLLPDGLAASHRALHDARLAHLARPLPRRDLL